MEKARRKLRMCLVCMVAAAVLIGCIYYFGAKKNKSSLSEGTLVMTEAVHVIES